MCVYLFVRKVWCLWYLCVRMYLWVTYACIHGPDYCKTWIQNKKDWGINIYLQQLLLTSLICWNRTDEFSRMTIEYNRNKITTLVFFYPSNSPPKSPPSPWISLPYLILPLIMHTAFNCRISKIITLRSRSVTYVAILVGHFGLFHLYL